MEEMGMTAKISAFSRAYHYEKNKIRIFTDSVAKKILTNEEYDAISNHMANGIDYFYPGFEGTKEEALQWIVEHALAPTPLGRAAFAEKSLEIAVRLGAKQYFICGAGLDSFAYRKPEWANELSVFEMDFPATLRDKQKMLKNAAIEIPEQVYFLEVDFTKDQWEDIVIKYPAYDKCQTTFISVLGMVYYLSKAEFESYLKAISKMIAVNSSIVFDYPNEHYFESQKNHVKLATASKEDMKACYTYRELTLLLQKYHFQVFEHLNQKEITKQYFEAYNQANPEHQMEAQENVCYCLAVKIKDN